MSPTFELVLNQVRSLTPGEQSKLVDIITEPKTNGSRVDADRLNKIRSFRGKYRKILPSTKEFIAQKRAEILIEER